MKIENYFGRQEDNLSSLWEIINAANEKIDLIKERLEKKLAPKKPFLEKALEEVASSINLGHIGYVFNVSIKICTDDDPGYLGKIRGEINFPDLSLEHIESLCRIHLSKTKRSIENQVTEEFKEKARIPAECISHVIITGRPSY